jgi:hypothetical protein
MNLCVTKSQPRNYEGKVAADLTWDGYENGWVPLPD